MSDVEPTEASAAAPATDVTAPSEDDAVAAPGDVDTTVPDPAAAPGTNGTADAASAAEGTPVPDAGGEAAST